MVDGNDIAVRAVAETLFDTWKARQEAEEKRSRFGSALPAWVTCALAILGVVMLAGGTNQRVIDNERRIERLEGSDGEQVTDARATSSRLASIEAKLDLIIRNER